MFSHHGINRFHYKTKQCYSRGNPVGFTHVAGVFSMVYKATSLTILQDAA